MNTELFPQSYSPTLRKELATSMRRVYQNVISNATDDDEIHFAAHVIDLCTQQIFGCQAELNAMSYIENVDTSAFISR